MTTKTNSLTKFRVPLLLVGVAVVMLLASVINAAVADLGPISLVVGLATAVGGLFAYTRLSRWLEQREDVPELARAQARPGLLRGLAIGAGAFIATMLLIGVFGGWDKFSGGSFWGFVASFGVMASAAVNEELLFRGVIFRFTQKRFGTGVGVALSAILFGGLHLLNSGATLWGAIAIAIEAGVTLALCYAATRSLWLPIGFHFAWNLFESGVFGTTVSGASNTAHGLLNTTLSGPAIVTGGSFGPEASLFAIVVCIAPIAFFIRKLRKTQS
jgi:membrane protease YdiL (CAAX protease family)